MANQQDGTIGIIIIGTEILSGQIRELNMHTIIKYLNRMHYTIREVRIVMDDEIDIATAVGDLANAYEFVITTGGIGPTHDDITLRAIGRAFDQGLQLHTGMRAILQQRFEEIPAAVLNRLTLLPTNTEVYDDGYHWPLISVNNCYALPGLPNALKRKLQRLAQILPIKPERQEAELFLLCKEVNISEWLLRFQERHSNVNVGIYPPTKITPWNCRVTLTSQDLNAMVEALNEILHYTRSKRWLLNNKTNMVH